MAETNRVGFIVDEVGSSQLMVAGLFRWGGFPGDFLWVTYNKTIIV